MRSLILTKHQAVLFETSFGTSKRHWKFKLEKHRV